MLRCRAFEYWVWPVFILLVRYTVVCSSLLPSSTAAQSNNGSIQLERQSVTTASTETTQLPNELVPEDVFLSYTSQEECYNSWTSYYQDLTTPVSNVLTPTMTITEQYETIERFGPGTVYYNRDDNIPRFRFTGNITRSESYTVNVTKTMTWMEDSTQGQVPVPGCLLEQTSTYCELLWAAYHKELRASGLNPVPVPPRLACRIARKCELQAGNDEVMLIYFPPDTVSSNPDSRDGSRTSSTVVMTAITFSGQDLYYRGEVDGPAWLRNALAEKEANKYIKASTMTGNFTFVSPTIYLAHHAITAALERDRGGFGVGSWETMSLTKAGIIALHPTDVYSLSPVLPSALAQNKTRYAQLVAQGKFDHRLPLLMDYISTETYPHTTKPFNFDHLRELVPADVYFDARAEDCWGKQTHCGTITDGTYRPRLYIKGNYWQKMLPKDFDCAAPALVDPPLALSRISDSETQKPRIPNTRPFVTLAFNNFPEVRPTGAQPGIAIDPSLPTPTGRTEAMGYDNGAANMIMGGHLGNADGGRQSGDERHRPYGKQGEDKTHSVGMPASNESNGHNGRKGEDKSQGGGRENSKNGYENPTKTRSGMSAAEDGIHSRPALYANNAASSTQTVKWLLVLHSLWMMVA
jgi:hypothetical protein